VFQPRNCFDVELRRVRRLVGKRFLHLIYRWLRPSPNFEHAPARG
jgi:hypothetical protein